MDSKFVSVVANHHEGNAIVERASRTIHEHLAGITLAKARTSVIDLVATATFYGNTSRGHHKVLPFALIYNRTPKLSTVYSHRQHGSIEEKLLTRTAVKLK